LSLERIVLTIASVQGPILLLMLLLQLDEPPQPDTVWRDEVVVTASRREETLREVAAHVTVLAEQEIEQSAATSVEDLLRQVPGFSLFRRSSGLVAHPTSQGVSLRGIGPSGASRTLVLLDGVPLNDPFGGWVQWGRVPQASLARIEVVRGGGSDLWGSSALGGVIQLLTGTPGQPSLSGVLEGGNHDQLHAAARAGRQRGPVGVSIDVSRLEGGGYRLIREDQRGAIDIDAFSEVNAFYGKLDLTVSPAATVLVRGNLFDEDRGNGTPLTNNATTGGYLTAGLAQVGESGGEWTASLAGHRQDFASTFSSQSPDRGSETPALDQFDVSAEALSAATQWTGAVSGRHRLTAGVDARWVDAENAEDFFFSAEANRLLRRRRAGGEQLQGALYLQDELDLTERWQVTLGGRVDAWSNRSGFRVERAISDGAVLLAEEFPDRDEVTFSPRLSTVYAARERLLLRGALYRAFRAPTINELYRPFRVRNDITTGNAGLDPEILTGAEFGIDLGTTRSSARLTAFWNREDDAISNVTLGLGPGTVPPCGFVPEGGICRQRQNLEEVRIAGLEAEAEHRPSPFWRISVSYLLSRPEIREAPQEPGLEGNRLAQVPEHQAVARLDHTNVDRLAGSLQLRYVGEQFEDDLNTLTLADALTVDLLLRRRVCQGLELFLAVENVFDETIEAGRTADGLVSIGAPRLVHGGLRFRLGDDAR
jgi:outer membrane receptor protein involved in Fe transport